MRNFLWVNVARDDHEIFDTVFILRPDWSTEEAVTRLIVEDIWASSLRQGKSSLYLSFDIDDSAVVEDGAPPMTLPAGATDRVLAALIAAGARAGSTLKLEQTHAHRYSCQLYYPPPTTAELQSLCEGGGDVKRYVEALRFRTVGNGYILSCDAGPAHAEGNLLELTWKHELPTAVQIPTTNHGVNAGSLTVPRMMRVADKTGRTLAITDQCAEFFPVGL
jgi:hypothetical protein